MVVTFTPFGVASEYSCSGWRPIGSVFSCVAPATGRLMLANWPPLGLFQVQTFGGTYSVESVIHVSLQQDCQFLTTARLTATRLVQEQLAQTPPAGTSISKSHSRAEHPARGSKRCGAGDAYPSRPPRLHQGAAFRPPRVALSSAARATVTGRPLSHRPPPHDRHGCFGV